MRQLASIGLIGSLLASAAGATTLFAQGQPVPGPGGGAVPGFGAPGVEMLLSQTGALQLSDAQVVRLAAIARRTADRRRSLMTRLDSLRPRRAPGGDSTARRERPMPPTDLFTRERDAAHADLRDALAVLTADQQARAWEMVAARRAMPFGRGGMMRQRSGRDGARRDGAARDGASRGRSGGTPAQRRPDQGS
jgi:hypothetical protein